jgi:hypothetical protein
LVKISKEEFQNMMELGFIKTDKWSKNFSITGRKKGKSARKHHFVVEPDYEKYLRKKQNLSQNLKGS